MKTFIAVLLALCLVGAPSLVLSSTTDFVVVTHVYDFDPNVGGSYAFQAHCPSDRPVVIGGSYIPGDPSESFIQYPQNASPNLWKVETTIIPNADGQTVYVYGICTSGTVQYITE